MPIFSHIPERYKDGFKSIASIGIEEFGKILKILTDVPLTSTLPGLVDKVANLTKFDSKIIEDIIVSTASLVTFLEQKYTHESVYKDLCETAIADDVIEQKDGEKFKERVRLLLESEQVFYASKSNNLITEYQNVFIHTNIVTDLRPVLGINLDEMPKAALIMHSLHLHYQKDEEGSHRDVYISLDSKDLQTLKSAIQRAEEKEKLFEKMNDKLGIINLKD